MAAGEERLSWRGRVRHNPAAAWGDILARFGGKGALRGFDVQQQHTQQKFVSSRQRFATCGNGRNW
jgi:hypothetical protein